MSVRYVTYLPAPALRPWVRCYWGLSGDASARDPFVHRTVADGCVEIVFHVRERFDEIGAAGRPDYSSPTCLQGPSTAFRRYRATAPFAIFGAYLYPHAVPRLFSIPVRTITNASPDLGTALGRAGTQLERRLLGTEHLAEHVALLDAFLNARLAAGGMESAPMSRAIATIIGTGGAVRLDALVRACSLSTRQFQRRFIDFAGLTPKLFQRVVRFQAATHRLTAPPATLARLAAECGYYDQSHLVRDFREFAGYAPSEYFRGGAEGTQYLAG